MEQQTTQTKMGRKPKAPEEIVMKYYVWLRKKDVESLEKKYGSLTSALRTLVTGPVKEEIKQVGDQQETKKVSDFIKQRQRSKNKME